VVSEIDRPAPSDTCAKQEWTSDLLAEALRKLGIEYLAINPGSSLRGLHDSIVNYLGNRRPQLLLCLHDEHTVAIAHGYAKVTQRPMGAAVHANVGLLHAGMAVFNAYCDRAPVLVLGATGPLDASRRRPWIDWVHTSHDQGGLVRQFVKWDDQPGSLPAAVESITRAVSVSATLPRAPVYVCLDVSLQEAAWDGSQAGSVSTPALPPSEPPAPVPETVERIASLLLAARSPVLLAGRLSRDQEDWDRRVELAERLGCTVITDRKVAAAFPTGHVQHGPPPGLRLSRTAKEVLRRADVVLTLDWIDAAGTIKAASMRETNSFDVISVGLDRTLSNSTADAYQTVPNTRIELLADPDTTVRLVLDQVRRERPRKCTGDRGRPEVANRHQSTPGLDSNSISLRELAEAVCESLSRQTVSIVRVPIGWPDECLDIDAPLSYLGADGGAGVGSGPGLAVGAALALQGTSRLAVAVLGDGDYLMGASALWTAAHYRLPLLVIVANNESYFNDELHQEQLARLRKRPVENRWVGQRIAEPSVDITATARAFGAAAFGPVHALRDLGGALQQGLDAARDGHTVVVDVVVEPGYAASTAETTT
jgi:thiamine pyrophosphate-dependent acetolactate synthase large subunit-like protein